MTAKHTPITAIIQARMSSTRLPGKILKNIEGEPLLNYVIKQTLASRYIKNVIIATTDSNDENIIVDLCKKNKIQVFRGSKQDLLDRYYKCALKYGCDPIIRITSDCPLIDPEIIDKIIEEFITNNYDYVSNNLKFVNGKWENSTCNFPQGMTVEVSNFKTLETAWIHAKKLSEREHVFPYIQFNPKIFKIQNVTYFEDLSNIRCTVDRKEDLEFVQEIYKRIPKNINYVRIKDIKEIINKNPELLDINSHISFDEGWKKSLKEDNENQ